MLRLVLIIGLLLGTNANLQWVEDCHKLTQRGIREDTPVGKIICVLNATNTDPTKTDSGIIYTVPTNVHIRVDQQTGGISLKRNIDYENMVADSFYMEQIQFTAVQGIHTIETKFKILILDVNDNSPQFDNAPYAATIAEDSKYDLHTFSVQFNGTHETLNGTLIPQLSDLKISDADISASNAEIISLTIHDDHHINQLFTVTTSRLSKGRYVGKVYLTGALDYERDTSYVLTLTATDSGKPPQKTSVNVLIKVGDSQDASPIFKRAPIAFFVPENTAVNTNLQSVSAMDPDGGALGGRPLVLEIQNDPENLFKISTTRAPTVKGGYYTADILVNKEIDREVAAVGPSYVFEIKATELNGTIKTDQLTVAKVQVSIHDLNDNKPIWSQNNMNIEINENLEIGVPLDGVALNISDIDGSTQNSKIALSIIEDPYNAFKLVPDEVFRASVVAIQVVNNTYLDYEKAEFRTKVIKLKAVEIGTSELHAATCTVTINLRDENDNRPRFSKEDKVYEISVDEDTPVGTEIGGSDISATDLDGTPQNNEITYLLAGPNKNVLTIDPKTAKLTLNQALDFEKDNEYGIEVEACDAEGECDAAHILLLVEDINDNKPVFDKSTYRGTVEELSTAVIPPLAVVVDKDEDLNPPTNLTLSIASGNTPDDAFYFLEEGAEHLLTLRRGLHLNDTRTATPGRFQLSIVASDNGEPAHTETATVEVTLVDINDHAPVFSQSSYTASITENSLAGQNVIRVSATDDDTRDNGKVFFQIQSGNFEKFNIDENSGDITVARSNSFDVNQAGGKLYTLRLLATDLGSPTRSAFATVAVTVTDSNNKLPKFSESVYSFQVREDEKVGQNVGSLAATDPDASAVLHFEIVPNSFVARSASDTPFTNRILFDFTNCFQVHPTTGALTTAATMDRSKVAVLEFQVSVEDLRAENPRPQRATTTVHLRILQVLRENPVFGAPWTRAVPQIYIPLAEEMVIGSRVTTLIATDPTSGTRLSVTKIVSSDPDGVFEVSTTGVVTLLRRLDYEAERAVNQRVTVKARTNDGREALCTLIVVLQDKNDNKPQFLQSSYLFEPSENARFPEQIGGVLAQDLDSGDGGTLTYSLHGAGAENFVIDARSGVIRPRERTILDRENRAEYVLQVKATDSPNAENPSSRRVATVPLTIRLKDINDNAPVFTMRERKAHIFENVLPGTLLMVATADDPDDGVNGQVAFSVINGNALGLFALEPLSGRLSVARSLLGFARPAPYVLRVQAADAGAPRKMVETIMEVVIQSLTATRGAPVIEKPRNNQEFHIAELSPVGTLIVTAAAHDADGPDNLLRFQLVGGRDVDSFQVDPVSGKLTTSKLLKISERQRYEVILQVKDENGTYSENPARIFLLLSDVNNDPPRFKNCDYGRYQQEMPVFLSENSTEGTQVARLQACDDDEGVNQYKLYSFTCGAEDGHFRIETSPDYKWATIYTNKTLNREEKRQYLLCITVTNTRPVYNGTRVRRDVFAPDTTHVRVILEDVNDNGPKYIKKNHVTSVASNPNFQSDVYSMKAWDPDTPQFQDEVYSITHMVFIPEDTQQDNEAAGAFVIGERTGMVQTSWLTFYDYMKGRFELTVLAKDSVGREAVAQLRIFVLGATTGLKLVLDMPPQQAQLLIEAAFANISAAINCRVAKDRVTSHANERGLIDELKTDACFNVECSSKLIHLQEARRLLIGSSASAATKTVTESLKAESVGYCRSFDRYKTYNRVGRIATWWVLVVLGIVLAFVALLLTLALHVFWSRYLLQRASLEQKYIPQ